MVKLYIALAFLLLISPTLAAEIAVVKVSGEINEGTYITLAHAIDFASQHCEALLVELNTPGGTLQATQKIVQLFMNSPIPVIVYVPKGAMCASAGSIILLSAHIAAMANGTAVGAATPVLIGFDSPRIENKTVNYMASYVKDIAKARGRNAEIAEKFVTEALTLTASEAYREGIIDVIANSRAELLKKIDGWNVNVDGRTVKLNTTSYQLVEVKKPLQASLYEVISNPQLAAILLLLGIYLLIFGLTSPGILPETIGAICLVLALAGMGVISINYIGAILIILGIIFLIAELSTPTYGVLGAASVVCVVVGLLLLFREPLMPESFYETFPKFVAGIGFGLAAIMTFAVIKIAQIRKKKSEVGEVVGLKGEVVEFRNGEGFAKVRGELWKIQSDDELEVGDSVVVVDREGLTLKVRKIERRGRTAKRDSEVAGED